MSANTCSYDCRNPPKQPEPEPDVSGIGVTLAYTITAGLAVCIFIAYYCCAYRPDVDPFHQAGEPRDQGKGKTPNASFRTNPIDDYILCWRIKPHHPNIHASRNQPESARHSRIQKAFINCMLLMSDFQLITGLAIMISGYARLRCGLSAYHWHKIVRLAWFSSITYLCCLTFLRDHFRRHKIAQLWRIPGMVALVVMLIVGMYPTTQYVWGPGKADSFLRPQDYAICYFWSSRHISGKPRIQMVAWSCGPLGVGMLLRLCCLYEAPSNACASLRSCCSSKTRAGLRTLFAWIDDGSFLAFFVAIVIYRPLFALFLTTRITTDVMTSKAFEVCSIDLSLAKMAAGQLTIKVWWLVISFAWGAVMLWSNDSVDEPESQRWSFGQIIALMVLLAPAIALIEGYLKGEPIIF
ncbi:hypothetical protein CC86DRAFT_380367 [Ophiobolus disseminans]|uniref:Uncharacterized protein n=1 Tax=Ophiobolus disseminans TaxID=1469910 RepID=A0A6A7A6Q6_9PLEO|nr:hypothetical protein CC86DRAFT_380367 [Ophiobolus disseminans]